MSPSTMLMRKLHLRTKLLMLFLIFLLPMLMLSTNALLVGEKSVATAAGEIKGAVIVADAIDVLVQVQKHRGQMNLMLAGQEGIDKQLPDTRAALKKALALLSSSIASQPAFELEAAWQPTKQELEQIADGKTPASAPESSARHTQLIAATKRFIGLTAEKSRLLLDPEAASFFLIDVAVQKALTWIEIEAQLRDQGAGLIKIDAADFKDRASLSSKLDSLQAAITSITDATPALKRAGEEQPAALQNAIDSALSLSQSTRKNLLGDLVTGNPAAFFSEGTQAIEQTLDYERQALEKANRLLLERKSRLQRDLYFTAFIVLFSSLVLIYLAYGFFRSFMGAMRKVQHAVTLTASGDLSTKVSILGADEFAQTGNSLESMNARLSVLVANIRSNAVMVSQLGQRLAGGLGDLASRTEQQASSLEQTAASVVELAGTVQKNAESAKAVDKLADNLRKSAESSGAAMQSAVESMNGIQAASSKVQQIVSVIDAIAFQTNILALNAAVEAARAGEQGRGFAVVAAEVRSLAQRSASSAKEIKTLIEDSVHRVGSGVTQIGIVNATLTEIVSGIQGLAGNVSAISSASAEQSQGLAQISEALRHLDEITQSNGQMAESALDTSARLDERASGLSESVASFKLRQGSADDAYSLVKKATSLHHARGRNALQEITNDKDKIFADRDMYVFGFDRQGTYRAFARNHAKVGTSILDINGLDGSKLIQDAFALAEAGGGWVDYTIVNPVTKNVESKTSYIEPVSASLVLGCGVYKTAA